MTIDLSALTKLDEPCEPPRTQRPVFNGITVDDLFCVVPTPKGDELVDVKDCEHPTRRMSLDEIGLALKECNPMSAKTVLAMKAVRVP